MMSQRQVPTTLFSWYYGVQIIIIIIIIIIINEKINVAYSPKTSRTRNKKKKKTATCSVDGSTEVTLGDFTFWLSPWLSLLVESKH